MLFESDCTLIQFTLTASKPAVSLKIVRLLRPWGKPSPSITAQHELVFALQAPLPPDTFISYWHCKGPHLSLWFDLDHSCFSSFLPSSCQSPLLLSFTKGSHLHLIIITFLTSSALHPFTLFLLQFPTVLKPFLSDHFSFPYFLYFPWAQVSCPFHCNSFPHLYPFPNYMCPIFLMHHSGFPLQNSILFSPFQHMCKHYSISQVPL